MYQPSLEILNKKRIILADDSPEIEALLKNVVRDGSTNSCLSHRFPSFESKILFSFTYYSFSVNLY